MKKPMVLGIALMFGSLAYLPQGLAQQDSVQSLRGMTALDAPEPRPVLKHWMPDREPERRDYVQQPPLVPHETAGYQVNLKYNKCLSCHSWSNYKEARATKISQTHFEDRNGNVLADVSASRYFCTQCHVPQVDAKPLVENTFTPVGAVR